jgi:hypothetical protein
MVDNLEDGLKSTQLAHLMPINWNRISNFMSKNQKLSSRSISERNENLCSWIDFYVLQWISDLKASSKLNLCISFSFLFFSFLFSSQKT